MPQQIDGAGVEALGDDAVVGQCQRHFVNGLLAWVFERCRQAGGDGFHLRGRQPDFLPALFVRGGGVVGLPFVGDYHHRDFAFPFGQGITAWGEMPAEGIGGMHQLGVVDPNLVWPWQPPARPIH